MSFVLDASVAIPWFLSPKDEKWWWASRELLDQVERNPGDYLVPEQFFFEVFSVLCRNLPDAEKVEDAMEQLGYFLPARYMFDHALAREAARLALDHGLSGYDACYVALAKLTGSVWLTADRAAHERVAPLGLSRLVG